MRQLPIETDPPEHTEYRGIVEPFFKRHRDPEVIDKVGKLLRGLINEAIGQDSVEVVGEFALPLQCAALTYLLNVSPEEADVWIDWGIHVFVKDGDGDAEMDTKLEDYLNDQFDKALENPGDDFYSALTRSSYSGSTTDA